MTTETPTTAQTNTGAVGTGAEDDAAVDTTLPEEGQPPAEDATPGTDNPADGNPPEEGEDEPAAEGAPEQYGEFTLPEGYQLDETLNAQFTELARELNLTQEQAQRFIDLDAARSQATAEAAAAQWEAQRDEWRTAVKSDAEIGGARQEQSLAAAAKARDAFGTDELKAMLDESGLGDHPEINRFFSRVGQAISEDRLVTGEHQPAGDRPFYKNSDMNR